MSRNRREKYEAGHPTLKKNFQPNIFMNRNRREKYEA